MTNSVKGVIDSWGLPSGTITVTSKQVTIGSTAKLVLVLHWEPAWGTAPTARELPGGSMNPIEARLAVMAAQSLAGWAKLSPANQAALQNLLGGETNLLSVSARANFKGKLADIKTKTDTQQKTALEGIITSNNSLPGVVDETVVTAKVNYTMDPAVDVANYAFRGRTANAEKTVVKYDDSVNVPIFAPKGPTPGLHNHTVAETADAAAYLPKPVRQLMTEIVLNPVTNPEDPHWSAVYHTPNFHSYMTAGAAGSVTIYPDSTAKNLPSANYQRSTFLHETGHTWSYTKWGTNTNAGKWLKWKAAMAKDRVAASQYAKNDVAEDVAETITVYASTKGSPAFAEYEAIMPERFKILAAEYDK